MPREQCNGAGLIGVVLRWLAAAALLGLSLQCAAQTAVKPQEGAVSQWAKLPVVRLSFEGVAAEKLIPLSGRLPQA